MRVITTTRIKQAMLQYPQWRVGLDLWIATFSQKGLSVVSYQEVRDKWKQASGWNTDRVAGARLKNEDDSYGSIYDLYIFDIHGTDCRILSKISKGTIYIRAVFSHAEYDKWCNNNIHQGKMKKR